jgi:mannonate dehydratase
MANDADIACHNSASWLPLFNAATRRSLGCPVMQNGYLHVNETPGWGIEVDETAAARFRSSGERRSRAAQRRVGRTRRRDGTVIKQ